MGTRFTVEADGQGTRLSVAQGRVRLEDARGAHELGTGEAGTSLETPLSLIQRLQLERPSFPGRHPLATTAPLPAELSAVLADGLGLAITFRMDLDWGEDRLRDPAHPSARLMAVALARRDHPVVVHAGALVRARILDPPDAWPVEAVLRDASGAPIHPVGDPTPWQLLSPIAPERIFADHGRRIGQALRQQYGRRGLRPVAVLWHNDLGLPMASAATAYHQDPRVAAALPVDDAGFAAWCSRQSARANGIALAAARAASTWEDVPWIELDGGWPVDRGRYAWWRQDCPDPADALGYTAIAAPFLGGTGWEVRDPAGTPADPLTRALAVAAGNAVLGVPRMRPVVGGGDPPAVSGFARSLLMLGAEGFLVDDPDLASVDPDRSGAGPLPTPIARLVALLRAQADAYSARHPEPDGAVIAGSGHHPYAADGTLLPWLRLPVADDPGMVVIARRHRTGLVLSAWAQDGRPRTVRLDIPGVGAFPVSVPDGGVVLHRPLP
jgi:hypothetical protein